MNTMNLSFVLFFLTLMSTAFAEQQPKFSVSSETSSIKLGDQIITRISDPIADAKARTVQAESGFTISGERIRKEFAFFDDRMEFTFDYSMNKPKGKSLVLFLPLPKHAEATIIHGRTHPSPPQKVSIKGGEQSKARSNYEFKYGITGPTPPPDAAAGALFPLRYVTIKTGSYALSVDVHPAGANSEDPSYAETPLRIFSATPMKNGIKITAGISMGYSAFPGHIKGKMTFYPDGRSFERVHPFAFANEYGALEKFVRLDFSNGPQKRKSDPHLFGASVYSKATGFGWTTDTAHLEVKSTTNRSAIHGSFITSKTPASFRIDAPPGHYFLTLNFGNADGPAGPFRVHVNGEERLKRIQLGEGRFKNESLLLKATSGTIEIHLEGLDNAAWLLNGLTLEPLGTLNEDYVFSKSWWNFSHQ